MNIEILEKVKKHTIAALVSDEIFMGILVLKGGNALNLAYDITDRGSIDIDFSIESDFTHEELDRLRNQAEALLNSELVKDELVAFDVKIVEKPKVIDDSVKSFWGGYFLEFKTISLTSYREFGGNIDLLRRNAISLHENHSSKFTVDISKYEFVGGKKPIDIEGSTVYVYTPEMLALEKLRALCQQNEDYKKIVVRMTAKSRARDFYDIYNIANSFKIDFSSPENIELCENIFNAKKVPIHYIQELSKQKELHESGWQSVVDTISHKESLNSFNNYFEFVQKLFQHFA